ncbi:GlxA family transcriptional regulator [Noviherbaspirillum galbum]|uniref:Helix-turn-helix domain-containing protein n=1 Tax=Noviherbaspirillum galbum TaxID=2709383 RepID=A0A6B3SU25_9BURK|nr:helix-turn-helix domain-containing protein [Noviherbaspirillum galbum]NEX62376.1 helix-turn-helix domain-containing protein [Noviherbaspirillum galbum]
MTPPSRSPRRASIKIGLLVYPGCMPAGLFAASDLFRAINRRMGKPVFDPVWIGAESGRVELVDGPVLHLDHALREPCDAYLLPGFWAESAADLDRMLDRQARLLAWLRQLPKQTALWTYCMGVALVAAAGRIDRCEATATWWLERPLRERFAAIRWDFRQAVVEDRSIVTAAGANGYWALLNWLLMRRIPAEVLRDVERAMLVPRSDTGHPAFRPVELMVQADPQLQRLVAHVRNVPAAGLNLGIAADYLAVSARTLSRRIERHAQVSAGKWLRLVKLAQVADALVASTASMKTICGEAGFADEASLMRTFKRVTGMTTSQYRQQYGRPLEHAGTGER